MPCAAQRPNTKSRATSDREDARRTSTHDGRRPETDTRRHRRTPAAASDRTTRTHDRTAAAGAGRGCIAKRRAETQYTQLHGPHARRPNAHDGQGPDTRRHGRTPAAHQPSQTAQHARTTGQQPQAQHTGGALHNSARTAKPHTHTHTHTAPHTRRPTRTVTGDRTPGSTDARQEHTATSDLITRTQAAPI